MRRSKFVLVTNLEQRLSGILGWFQLPNCLYDAKNLRWHHACERPLGD